MAGDGAAPIKSAWLVTGAQQLGAAILYGRIAFGDNNTDEGTLWNNWFFGAVVTSAIKFRKTLSPLGSGAGKRQAQGS